MTTTDRLIGSRTIWAIVTVVYILATIIPATMIPGPTTLNSSWPTSANPPKSTR